ncbi:hypothetical protein SADUNF_Sadunf02G0194400 [Salix dunnii]|uniref:Uncharacterized protein n=1 Tax=Salix dunnii TaxID=1413687 RepID=A0A835TI10_9ROSI|nr:hypothetical protein SADUNF_Sadunf02G0194400 [Salix dunnii]
MSGQTQGVKSPPPLRGYRRRKTVLDLNAPPIEGRDDEGTSTTRIETPQGVQASHQRNGQGPSLPPTIDVDAFDDDDDDVIESSPRAFAQAKNNSRRAVVVDVESGGRLTHNKRRRVPPSQTIINCDLYINLEGGSSSSSSKVFWTLDAIFVIFFRVAVKMQKNNIGIMIKEGECADHAAKGANLQLPNLSVSIGRGDVNKMRTHFLYHIDLHNPRVKEGCSMHLVAVACINVVGTVRESQQFAVKVI